MCQIVADNELVQKSAKIKMFDALCKKLKHEKSRFVLFSRSVRILEIIAQYMEWQGYEYLMLVGATTKADRDAGIQKFNADPKIFGYLISTNSGGVGIDLSTADAVILFDTSFNPESDNQAMTRVHRYGQQNEVRVFRLLVEDTIQEHILIRSLTKSKLNDTIMGGEQLQFDIAKESNASAIAFITAKMASGAVTADDNPINIEQLITTSTNFDTTGSINDVFKQKILDYSKEMTYFHRTNKIVHRKKHSVFAGVDFAKLPKEQPNLIVTGKRQRNKPDWLGIVEETPAKKRRRQSVSNYLIEFLLQIF